MNLRLDKEKKIKIGGSADIYKVMQYILLRQQLIDRNREHFWTIGLATDHSILFVELVSMGTINATYAEPMEVFSFALQKRAVKLILVHNHPSGNIQPSREDKDTTDRLIQTGNIVNIPVLDHLIIAENTYYSFGDSGLLQELQASLKYVPPYVIKNRYEQLGLKKGTQKGEDRKAREMAKAMKKNGEPIEKIIEYTGLSEAVIRRMKS